MTAAKTETPTPAERERWQRLADDVAGMPLTAKEPMLAAAISALLSALARAEARAGEAERERDRFREMWAELQRAAEGHPSRDGDFYILHGHETFVGPCVHGRDPWTRCDECGEGNAVDALLKVTAALRSERDALAAALRPFANFTFGPRWAGHMMRRRDGDTNVLCGYDAEGRETGVDVNYSDFARARAALATPSESRTGTSNEETR
jgi:hypothetical protein